MDHSTRLPAHALRWHCDETQLDFTSTAELDPAKGVLGQPIALAAMRFGVECDAPGQNIYVRGLSGTGRMTLVRAVLEELDPQPRRRLDRCYVHNFSQPDRPRLLTLAAGQGPVLRKQLRQCVEFIGTRLGESLESQDVQQRMEAIKAQTQAAVKDLTAPLEQELHDQGLTLVQLQNGPVARSAVYALREGQPVAPEVLRQQVLAGELDAQEAEQLEQAIAVYSQRVDSLGREAAKAWQQGLEAVASLVEDETRTVLNTLFQPLREAFDQEPLHRFIGELIEDVIENRLPGSNTDNLPDAQDIYGVNVVITHSADGPGPVITEHAPTVANLLGRIEPDFVSGGQPVSNYNGIRAGALLQADGGFLALDANDVLSEPGAWRLLMRALRTGSVTLAPTELGLPQATQSLKPEPIDIQVRVILIGSSGLFYQLDQVDQDFSDLFKVLADFDSEIDRDDQGVMSYAGVLAKLCHEEDLPHFTACGVAAMAEHGARIAARRERLTARFGRVADIAREAAFRARQANSDTVQRSHVEHTIRQTRYRASLPSQRYQQLIADRTIGVETHGSVVGQINGMAVIHAGPLAYGFPARLTATVGPGRAGVIDIEGAAALAGSIHTKGFHILGGLLRYVLRTEHPLAFSASIAFEQSYGGIDGDSASGAEFCCLISALTGVPIRQGIAMTGAIDQHGHVQAIGGVNEKVDGHFDACAALGLDGTQGAIVPQANAGDLMLRDEVVAACEAGQFHVYAVETVGQALEVLTGQASGDPAASEPYAEDSLFALAQQQAAAFLRRSLNHDPKSQT